MGRRLAESVSTILGQLDGPDEDTAETSIEQLINENDSAIVRLVNQVIVDAYNQRVSDIHIEPQGRQREVWTLRSDVSLRTASQISDR